MDAHNDDKKSGGAIAPAPKTEPKPDANKGGNPIRTGDNAPKPGAATTPIVSPTPAGSPAKGESCS